MKKITYLLLILTFPLLSCGGSDDNSTQPKIDYEKAYKEGFDKGFEKGYDDSFYEGQRIGYHNGYLKGKADHTYQEEPTYTTTNVIEPAHNKVKRKCGNCGGSGYLTCILCAGQGVQTKQCINCSFYGYNPNCSECFGKGKTSTRCDYCNGLGGEDCPTCNGNGYYWSEF